MITIKNRKLIIPKEDRVIGTVSDNNSETRIFVIDRYLANGIDLAALTFGMDMEYEDGTKNTTYLTKEVTDEIINLTWGIVAGDVQKSGTMFVQITAFDYDGTVKWATIRDAFYVEPVIGTAEQYTGDLSAFQRMEVVLDQKLEQIEGFLEDIDDIEEAEADRVEAENGRVEAEGDRVLAEEGRVEAESQREATFGTLSKEAEAWAVGTKDGSPVASTDPQYHNNSKYYAEAAGTSAQSASDDAALALEYKENAASSASNASTSETNAGNSETAAAGSATSAETNALKAEGFSVGKQNNQDVTSGSPYYHNNAAYYAEQAAASAEEAAAIVGGHFVSYDEQPLAPADQKQVRTNIAAIGYAGFTSIMNTILPRDDSRDEVFTSSQEHFYAAHAHAEGSLFWITIDEEVYLVVADQAIAVGDEIAYSEVNIMNTIEDIYDKLANIYTKTQINTALAGKADGLQLVGDRLSLMSGSTELDYVNITTGASSIVEIPEPKTKTYTYNGQVQTFEWDSIDSDHIALSGNTNTNAGSYTVTATLKNPADVWLEPDGTVSKDPKTFAWTIAKAQGSFDLSASSVSVDFYDPSATVNATNIFGDGAISVASSDPTVATAAYSNGVITITGLTTGTATVTATMAETTNYLGASATISVTASGFSMTISFALSGAAYDVVTITGNLHESGNEVTSVLDNNGNANVTMEIIPNTNYLFTSSAPSLDGTGNYSTEVTLQENTSTVNISKLPSGYAEVPYIQSSGSQYIDTGYVVKSTDIEGSLDFQWLSFSDQYSHQYQMLCGSYDRGTDRKGFNLESFYQNQFYVFTLVGSANSVSIPKDGNKARAEYNIEENNVNLKVSVLETIYTKTEAVTALSGKNMFLFAQNDSDTSLIVPRLPISARVFGCRFKNSSGYTCNLIPCKRVSDGVAGMYDIINNSFRTNSGSGTFSIGTSW